MDEIEVAIEEKLESDWIKQCVGENEIEAAIEEKLESDWIEQLEHDARADATILATERNIRSSKRVTSGLILPISSFFLCMSWMMHKM